MSKHDTPSGIMMHDNKTIDSLRERLFGNNYKGDKSLVITTVLEKKMLGIFKMEKKYLIKLKLFINI